MKKEEFTTKDKGRSRRKAETGVCSFGLHASALSFGFCILHSAFFI